MFAEPDANLESKEERSLLSKRKFCLTPLEIPQPNNREILQVVDEAEGLLLLRSPVVRSPVDNPVPPPQAKRAKVAINNII